MKHDTRTRYGVEVDEATAIVMDKLDNEFKKTIYRITDHRSLAVTNNRHMTVHHDDEHIPDGKVPREIFEAIRRAGFIVTGVHTGIGGQNDVRIWIA